MLETQSDSASGPVISIACLNGEVGKVTPELGFAYGVAPRGNRTVNTEPNLTWPASQSGLHRAKGEVRSKSRGRDQP
jgi:hypothetical protein